MSYTKRGPLKLTGDWRKEIKYVDSGTTFSTILQKIVQTNYFQFK